MKKEHILRDVDEFDIIKTHFNPCTSCALRPHYCQHLCIQYGHNVYIANYRRHSWVIKLVLRLYLWLTSPKKGTMPKPKPRKKPKSKA